MKLSSSINGTQWKIQRGIKPAIFKIWRDDNLLDQSAAANDQQKWLEQNVLKMNYKSFTQIVIWVVAPLCPSCNLLQLISREVIEDLLDIRIFSSMNTVIKEKIRSVKETVKVLELKKESLLEKVQMQENFIERLRANRGKKILRIKEKNIGYILNEENNLDGRSW